MAKLDLSKISEEDLATLAANGDSAALSYLWELVIPRIKRVVAKAVKPHRWLRLNREDIVQGVLLKFPMFVCRWDRDKATGSFDKWLYFTVLRVSQDVIREQKDSLGISYPQKMGYPEWSHIVRSQGSNASETVGGGHTRPSVDQEINEGLDRLDRGFPMRPPSENR